VTDNEAEDREPDSKDAPVPAEPPQQQLGDTPVAPWEMPTPEQKAAAEPVRRALTEALSEVDSPQQAERVAQQLVKETRGKGAEQAADATPPPVTETPGKSVEQAAREVERTAQTAPPGHSTERVVKQAVAEVEGAQGAEREALAQAVQEVLNPEQQGAPPDVNLERRQLLRRAVLKRMRPVDALDARLFLAVNHLPHNRIANEFFYVLTSVFTGGMAWFSLMGLVTLLDRRQGWRLARTSAVPLAIATAVVEYPVKTFFRRRRPFIQMVQAIVIGKKPGTWSFPSGHSAAAFAGAWLFSLHYPRLRWLLRFVAALVAFSRIYLGDHYPSDVVSGSLSGVGLALVVRRLLAGLRLARWPARHR
jgi:membrane-associated phospholipid phosphatase